MTGIVGPNGCGKSNIVDAIRWVMGETPRHIRAASLAEVIFSGTSNRKPVGQAFVELIFNNSEGTVQGEYAQYNELSLRREIARDSETKYYINNKRCRRKDIADIFLGTGLGTNSYAIIEQGMIARLIEAKPQEMWAYIEEAAGVSRYKERRRETETRIRNAREHLDRVLDLREEIDRQLRRLKRQGSDAKRYVTLCTERDTLQGDIAWLTVQEYARQCSEGESQLATQKQLLDDKKQALRSAVSALEKQRQQSSDVTNAEKTSKEKQQRLAMEIDTLHSNIKRNKELIATSADEQQQLTQQRSQLADDLAAERSKLQTASKRDAELSTAHEKQLAQLSKLCQNLDALEQEIAGLYAMRDKHQSETHESSETAKVARARSEVFHQVLREIEHTVADINKQRKSLNADEIFAQAEDMRSRLAQEQAYEKTLSTQLDQVSETIQSLRTKLHELNDGLHKEQEQMQKVQGEMVSLELLMEGQLGHDKESFHQWLKEVGLSTDKLLSNKVKVAEGWENAVETVLGVFLEGVDVDTLDNKMPFVSRFEQRATGDG